MRPYRYFLSCAAAHPGTITRKLCDDLIEQLESQGNEVVVYYRDFDQTKDFVVQIAEALVWADFTIAIITALYTNSNWCLKEFWLSHESQKLIQVIPLDDSLAMSHELIGSHSPWNKETTVPSIRVKVSFTPETGDYFFSNWRSATIVADKGKLDGAKLVDGINNLWKSVRKLAVDFDSRRVVRTIFEQVREFQSQLEPQKMNLDTTVKAVEEIRICIPLLQDESEFSIAWSMAAAKWLAKLLQVRGISLPVSVVYTPQVIISDIDAYHALYATKSDLILYGPVQEYGGRKGKGLAFFSTRGWNLDPQGKSPVRGDRHGWSHQLLEQLHRLSDDEVLASLTVSAIANLEEGRGQSDLAVQHRDIAVSIATNSYLAGQLMMPAGLGPGERFDPLRRRSIFALQGGWDTL